MNQQERREYMREYMRRYYAKNRDQILANKRYNYLKDPEKADRRVKKYRDNNRDKYNQYQNGYYHAHKEEINARRRERRAAKKAAMEEAAAQ